MGNQSAECGKWEILTWQNGPLPSISFSTAMALAGLLAMARVPNRLAITTTCSVFRFTKKPTRGPITRNARNTNVNENNETQVVMTIVGRGCFRNSPSFSSDPAATPITARHTVSVTATSAVCVDVSTAGPSNAPVSKYPLIFGNRKLEHARPVKEVMNNTNATRATVSVSAAGSMAAKDHIVTNQVANPHPRAGIHCTRIRSSLCCALTAS